MSEQFPKDLHYTKSHEWVRIEGNVATIGISHHAQDALGEVVYIELPQAGHELKKQESFGTLESIKAASDLYTPVSGKVLQVNTELINEPGRVNKDPYHTAWMIQIEITEKNDLAELMDVNAYKNLVQSL